MSAQILHLIDGDTIIGDVVQKDVEKQVIIVANPIIMGLVYGEDGTKYVTMKDPLKDAAVDYMPLNPVNIIYSYPAAPEVERYYRGCVPRFVKQKEMHIDMFKDMVKVLAQQVLKETPMMVVPPDRLQPSSNTIQ